MGGPKGLVGKKRRDAARAGFITSSMRLPAVCACRAAGHWFRRAGQATGGRLAGRMHGATGLPPYLRIA